MSLNMELSRLPTWIQLTCHLLHSESGTVSKKHTAILYNGLWDEKPIDHVKLRWLIVDVKNQDYKPKKGEKNCKT